MSIVLDNSDFQCLQDQLVDLKTKNYELAEKYRRSQADFEAAKAKICTLQLKLEEQERDFEVTSTTLRREIVSVTSSPAKETKDEDYKSKYKKLLHKAKELQQRYEKSVEIVQQLDDQNRLLNDKVHELEEKSVKLCDELVDKQKSLDKVEKELQQYLINRSHQSTLDSNKNMDLQLFDSTNELSDAVVDTVESLRLERDQLKCEIEKLRMEDLINLETKLAGQVEERKIHERKGLQIVKELKRQLNSEKNRSEMLQSRLENLLKQQVQVQVLEGELQATGTESICSSTNGNESANTAYTGSGSKTNLTSSNTNNNSNNDANSNGSWSLLPANKLKSSNQAINETISLCSIESEDRETVQRHCDTISDNQSMRLGSLSISGGLGESGDSRGPHLFPQSVAISSSLPIASNDEFNSSGNGTSSSIIDRYARSPSHVNESCNCMSIDEQSALMERITKLQEQKWLMEERLSYMEQANATLSEDVANKSEIIRQYFVDHATRTTNHGAHSSSERTSSDYANYGVGSQSSHSQQTPRRISFPNQMSNILAEKPSLRKMVEFIKDKSQLTSGESDSVSREATKKMQLMLEETLIKCLKLQENLDYVTMELNKFKS